MRPKTSLEQIKNFYSNNLPDFQAITDINRRHFRFLLPSGRFLKIKDTINNPDNLQKWLIKLKPLDVYYSTSTYLDPTSVKPRPKEEDEFWGPGNIILSNDIAFDLDRSPLSILNLERARRDAVNLLLFLEEKGYNLKYVSFSGSKGFHLIFDDIDKSIEPNIRIREKVIIEKRRALVHTVKKQGIKFDTPITVDTRRVIRLPGTINSKTGYCCQRLSIDDLNSPVSNWIDDILKLPSHVKIPRFKWDYLPKRKTKNRKEKLKKDTKYGYTTFITSSVLGIKGRHAVLLSFPNRSQKRVETILKKAQEDYNLTDFYLFKLPKMFQAICLKTVQRNRYQKILDVTKSSSANQLRNYNRVSLRMGPLVDQEMQTLEPPAKFVTILECDPKIRNRNNVSQGHINFLKKHGFDPIEYSMIHGNGEFKLVDAEIRL